MTEEQIRSQLKRMLTSRTPGTILHLLGEVIAEAELARIGDMDEADKERIAFAEGFLFVAGIGLDSVCPR